MKDIIRGKDMSQGNLTSFIMDRFGCESSALALNGGWTQVPQGVYFNTPEFTIAVWVYPSNVGSWSRILDFGNTYSDNIVLALSSATSLKPCLQIFSGTSQIVLATSAQALNLEQWSFLVATFNGINSRIYINGQLTVDLNVSYTLPTNVVRSNCYIGQSNWPGDLYSSSHLEDLRIYNKSLNQAEVLDLMSQNQTCKLI